MKRINISSNKHRFNTRPIGPIRLFKHIINEKKKIAQCQEVNRDMIELKHACISIDIPLEPMSLDPLF